MTKVITTETNLITPNHFKVVTDTRVVDDPGIRMSPRVQIHKKQVAHYKLLKKRNYTFKLIQHYQLLALKTDDDIEARQAQEYAEQILIPEMHRYEREMKALEIQIEKLRARV